MPQLIFKSVKTQDLREIAKELKLELSKITNTPSDFFTLEIINSTYIMDDKSYMYPIIEVIQFDRGLEIQDQMAKVITKYLLAKGYSEVEIFFSKIAKTDYYENGISCAK